MTGVCLRGHAGPRGLIFWFFTLAWRWGRPGARFARRLMAPVSNDTLLRSIRRCGRPGFSLPRVIGIDDWAWRRNQRYGTIICDLERYDRSTCCRTASPQPRGRGSPSSRRSPPSPAIAAVATRSPRRRRCRMRNRSRIVGISWKMPAAPSSTQCGHRCARSVRRSVPPSSIPVC